MSILNNISFGIGKKIPVILQTESSECGLACIAMIASYHGYHVDLFILRQKYSVSAKGSTLTTLMKIAKSLNLTTRPLRLELENLEQLQQPCILHWDLNHFVILKKISNNKVTIVDPAFGQRVLSLDEVSQHFTGIALELWPDSNFEEKTQKKSIKIFHLIGEISGLWKTFIQIIALAIVLEIFSLVSPFFMQWVIDNAIVSEDKNLLLTLALGFGILAILTQLLKFLQGWVVMYISTMLNVQWKANVFNHLTQLPYHFFIKRHLGDLISRFNSIDVIQKTLTTTFITSLLDGIMTIFTLILMFIYSPELTYVALFVIIVYGIVRWIWFSPLRRATEDQIIHATKQNTHFMETVRGIKTIQLFQKQDQRQKTWLTLFVNEINSSLATQKLNLSFQLINGLLFGLENVIIIYLGAYNVIAGNFTVGFLMAFIAYKTQFGTRVSSLIDKFLEIKMLSLHSERLADIVLAERSISGDILLDNNEIFNFPVNIEIKNIGFRYSEDEPWIIENISFNIKEGESIAIIGATGEGKSTLMNLLLNNLIPSRGEIKVGGKNIKKFSQQSYRAITSVVSQDDTLFAGSILDNITFFDYNSDSNWAEECAKMAAIHDEILAMPMGYQTLVGDMGSVLSGGQKQRILIARALYHKPRILFLDEATSHLDILKEKEINETISKLNITRIIIAHRPETINSANRVVTLKKGFIVSDVILDIDDKY